MQNRDAQGRFVKATNNKVTNNSNKKENDTMKTNNARENRMEALNNAGINTTNFFDVNMKLPMGAMIQVTMPNGEVHRVGGTDMGGFNGNVLTAPLTNDPIVNKIVESGYVKNTKLWRRFVAAYTFKLLGEVTTETKYRGEVVYRSDWDKNFNKNYGYMYCFDMLLEELRVISKLEKEDREAFEERSAFFTQDVVVALCKQYVRQLKKYVQKSRKNKKRTCRDKEYVRLAKYGDVFITDLQRRVYQPMEFNISVIESCNNYSELYGCFKDFCGKVNKLPFETPKDSSWKTAYKASGSYFTLKNMVMWHSVLLEGCKTSTECVYELKSLLCAYKGEYWRFHELLKKTIYDNNFDLAKSIEAHKNN